MSTLLKLLPLEMAELSDGDYIDPRQPIGRGEKVLGTLSDDEKKMYTLRVRTISTLKHLEADFDLATGTERTRVKTEIQRLTSRVEILDKLFWDMVNNDHNTWSANIGVRKGFVIVEMNPSTTGLGLLGRFMFGSDLSGDEDGEE